ncbi:prohibitin family protein [Desulfobacter sp.]|uniref:prohibitin family protein n=1 Tax=Desulfobacter sp. TaxID=2294 RepID=UPI003D0C7914
MALQTLKKKITTLWDKHTIGITVSLLILAFLIAFFWNSIVISIYPGQQGVRWSRFTGTQINEINREGLHLIWPWDVMYTYNTRVQTSNSSLQILTTEGLTITVDYAFRFYPIRDGIPTIHKTLGENYAQTFVDPEVKAASMSVIGNYPPEQLYRISTLVIQASIKYYLNKKMLARNIVLEDYLIKRIILPEPVAASIERKMVSDQLSQEYDYRLSIEKKERRRKSIEAQGIKSFETIAGIPILKWKGLEVTQELAKSPNSKIIIMGNGDKGLPLLLNADGKP